MKCYISPSSQTENRYAWGDYNEGQVCRQIGKYLHNALSRCGIENMLASEGLDISGRLAEGNKFASKSTDIYVCIHTNAGGGDGTLVLCWKGNRNDPYVLAVYSSVADYTPTQDDGIREVTNIKEIKSSKATCVYVECEFHDNATYAKWIVNHMKETAEAICIGICEGAGISYVPDDPIEDDHDDYIRVQCGAFKGLDNANALADKLVKAGFSVYLRPESGLYKVQIGAFSDRKNAEELARQAENAGFDTYTA